ncbi:hypothetical protein CC78DRAFT_617173 [Lojkania enalia]|uniref:Zn(2)-C6 fungal-type domain-containing protein n=1 Tax=Lojkania enalia TaxID=147567 RepID=A0A9P4K7E8_9PLEO|nr:hypothetical protein CC78DRAFT_617173 [Didymosphaeria enalia]
MADTAPLKKKRRGGPRRKTGWFNYTCKSRHSRCDEKKPVCSNCERLNLECKPSDFIAPSTYSIAVNITQLDSKTDENIPSTNASEEPNPTTITTQPEHSTLLPNPEPASTWEIFKTHIPGFDLISDDSPPTTVLSNLILPTPAPAPPFPPPTRSPSVAVNLTPESVHLLQTYLRTVAIYQDLTDFSQTYQLHIPRLIPSSPLLYHCICALTAKSLARVRSRQNASWEPVARWHYGEALRQLIAALNGPCQQHCLTATIVLSAYEIFVSLGQEHRRHFLGAYALIKARGISAQSAGIDGANFWIYVRHEIGVALATERPLMLGPDEWGVKFEEEETREDVLARQVLWILARAINLVYGEDGETDAGKGRRGEMLTELEEWRAGLSESFAGIPYGEEDDEGFRKVYFTVTAAAAAAFWYHITHILLYAEPTLQDEAYIDHIQDQAMRAANVVISDFPDSFRVFATHGLYYAAKHITGIARKARLWNIMNDVEAQLGYHTKTLVKRLQELEERGS